MKLKDCLGKREINAAQLARLIGYSPDYISRVISGSKKPSKKFLKVLQFIKYEEVIRDSYKKNVLKLDENI